MDFGLSEPRRKFFDEKKLLLGIPAGLSRTDHPYKLKSSMASFLKDEPSSMPIWIDCDIVAIRPEAMNYSIWRANWYRRTRTLRFRPMKAPTIPFRTFAIPLAKRSCDRPSPAIRRSRSAGV